MMDVGEPFGAGVVVVASASTPRGVEWVPVRVMHSIDFWHVLRLAMLYHDSYPGSQWRYLGLPVYVDDAVPASAEGRACWLHRFDNPALTTFEEAQDVNDSVRSGC